jgi:hypothetical protein
MNEETTIKRVGDVVTNTVKVVMTVTEFMKRLNLQIEGIIEYVDVSKSMYDSDVRVEIRAKMEDRLTQINYITPVSDLPNARN